MAANTTYIVPPIGSSGTFLFEEPFDNILFDDKQYTVRGIRTLRELVDSEEDPYTNIYATVEISESDFENDLNNGIPIIILADSGGKYYYVPANRIASLPRTEGVQYQEVMLSINLGYLPVEYDLELAKDTVVNDILATLGIKSTVVATKTSTIQYVDDETDSTFQKLLETRKTMNESYRTKYQILLQTFNAQQEKLKELQECYANHILN